MEKIKYQLCLFAYLEILFLFFSFVLVKNLYANDITLQGKVKVYRDNDIGMMICKLIKDDGEEIIIGTPGNMTIEARKCIDDAEDNNDTVIIYAKYAYDGIDDRTIICKNINNNISPEFFGIYLGMDYRKYLDILDNLVKTNKDKKYSIDDGRILTDGDRMLISGVFNENKLTEFFIHKNMFNLNDLRVDSFLNKFKQYKLTKNTNARNEIYYNFDDGNIKIYIGENRIVFSEN